MIEGEVSPIYLELALEIACDICDCIGDDVIECDDTIFRCQKCLERMRNNGGYNSE